jgi:hypothetical protein
MGARPSGDYAKHISAWVRAVTSANYVPEIYCSHRIAYWCRNQTPYLWTFRLPRGTSGTTYSPDQIPKSAIADGGIATQYRQNVYISGKRVKVDLDVSLIADSSNLAAADNALRLV